MNHIDWIGKSVSSAVILLVGVVLFLILKIAIKKFEELFSEKQAIRESEFKLRVKTIIGLFRWLGTILIVGGVAYMLLANVGINMGPLIAGAGIVGIAFGFGGQYLIRDLINGVFIMIEGHYRINDVVQIGDHKGLVETFNLRYTQLRDGDGGVIFIPNGEIKTVVNFTKDYSFATIRIGVAYKEKIDEVITVIQKVVAETRKDSHFGKTILSEAETLGVEEFADSSVNLSFRIKTIPSHQWDVAREVRRRLKNRFDELGIEIPFPQRVVRLEKE